MSASSSHLQRAEELHYSQDSHATVTEVCWLWQTSDFSTSQLQTVAEHAVFCTFSLENVLLATAAYNFSS